MIEIRRQLSLPLVCLACLVNVPGIGTTAALADEKETPKPAAKPEPAKPDAAGWKPLFDGKTLKGWRMTEFGGGTEPRVENGEIRIDAASSLAGITYTNEPPTMNYEISFEAMKIEGSDFFCSLTFLIDKVAATFVVGGWGGGVVGISSIDGMDASENETTKYMKFDKKRWYHVRVRVTPGRVQTWIDDEPLADLEIGDRKISLRAGEIDLSKPLGLATWQTAAAWRNIKIRTIK